jgi:hypothetical protein
MRSNIPVVAVGQLLEGLLEAVVGLVLITHDTTLDADLDAVFERYRVRHGTAGRAGAGEVPRANGRRTFRAGHARRAAGALGCSLLRPRCS